MSVDVTLNTTQIAATVTQTGIDVTLSPQSIDVTLQEGTPGVTDHGALTGLSDDDHTQYFNTTRGDARYSQLGHGHAISDVTGLQTALDTKLESSDLDGYATETYVDAAVAGAGGGGSWGTITGTLSDQTDLQTALDAKVNDADIRGGATDANARITTISNFASPNAGGYISGAYYDAAFHGSNAGSLGISAGNLHLGTFYTSQIITIDQIGVAVSAGSAGVAKVFIYSNGSNGYPDALLLTSSEFDVTTTGFKSASVSFTFQTGVQYWLGINSSSSPTIRSVSFGISPNFGLSSSTATNQQTLIRKSYLYADPLPNPFGSVTGTLVSGSQVPSIRFRVV